MGTVAIIGAGVAGLAAGRALARDGYPVSLFEKSRGLGGRVATRRIAGFAIDHGAQVFKAPAPSFQSLVTEIDGARAIAQPVWTFTSDGQISPGDPAQAAEASWTWPGGINTLARYLARGLVVHREVTITALRQVEMGYELVDASGQRSGPFAAVLLTPPAPQSAAILAASAIDPTVQAQLLDALAPARYRPCLSLAFAYPRRPAPPWYALLNLDRRHPIAWLACEHVKPDRAPAGHGLLLAQMAPAWSEQHWEALPRGTYGGAAPLPVALTAVHGLIGALLGADPGAPLWVDVQRWRYALADAPCAPAASAGIAGLFVAGDMVAGQGRVHLAIASGWAAAARIAAALGERQDG